jgi:N-acetylglucosaminyldiphosphoundecaprenol N-acetyl-beta-D-mannosaminyltransferase
MYSPPFRELTAAEEGEVAAKINASGARLVFVILGCPRQERWMARMKGRVDALMVGVGGALPVLIGMQRRAPVWMQRNGLEWLYRLMQEPRRLFWRYAVTNTVFCWLFITAVVNRSLMRKSVVTPPGNESVAV